MCSSIIPCPLCSQPAFSNSDSLRLALVSVATRHLPCPVCLELFLGIDKLTIHMFGHLHGLVQEKSVINFNLPQMEQNTPLNLQIEAKPVIHACDICGFKFNEKSILDMHKNLVHSSNTETINPNGQKVTIIPCHLCSKKFRTRGSLMIHLRVVHFGFPALLKRSDSDNEAKVFGCSVCKMGFRRDSELQTHLKIHDVNNNVAGNKQWECDVCSKLFTTKYFLKKHKRLHTGEMPYHCNQCNKAFTFQQSYHKHMLYHSSDKPHTCGECGRAFKELSTLHNHERIHSGERPFSCETCGKCFRQRVSCLVHRRIHTGAMPYHCTACGKKFRYKVSQRTHKCPAQPPGVVVRSGDIDESLPTSTPQTTLYVLPYPKPNTSIDDTIENSILSPSSDSQSKQMTAVQETNEEHFIKNPSLTSKFHLYTPSYKLHATTIMENQLMSNDSLDCKTSPTAIRDDTATHLEVIKNTDFFSLVLSPISENVLSPGTADKMQNLCLSNSPKQSSETFNEKETNLLAEMCHNPFSDNSQAEENSKLETINEESLKELLYGKNQKL